MPAYNAPARKRPSLSVAERIEARMAALKTEHAQGKHTHPLFGCPSCG